MLEKLTCIFCDTPFNTLEGLKVHSGDCPYHPLMKKYKNEAAKTATLFATLDEIHSTIIRLRIPETVESLKQAIKTVQFLDNKEYEERQKVKLDKRTDIS